MISKSHDRNSRTAPVRQILEHTEKTPYTRFFSYFDKDLEEMF